jgi:hypothetical protein
MILAHGKQISIINAGGKVIAAVYCGTKLVWEAIRSCFGSGRWINEKPWLNTEGWKNK